MPVWLSQVDGKWLSNLYPSPIHYSVFSFAAAAAAGAVNALCKALSISTAINNIVIIISTYRSYEYYSVCVLYAYIYCRLYVCMLYQMCYSTSSISVYWKMSTKRSTSLRMIVRSHSHRFMFENICSHYVSI